MEQVLTWTAALAAVGSCFYLGRYLGKREELGRRARQLAQRAEGRAVRPGLMGLLLRFAARFGHSLGPSLERLQLPGTEDRLRRAGHPLSKVEFLGLKALAGLSAFCLGIPLNFLGFLGPQLLLLILVGALCGPDLWVWLQIGNRRQAIGAALPDLLDTLSVAIQAGAGLLPALQVVAERQRGPMGEELRRTVEEIRLGRPLEQALEALLARTGVRDLEAVVQALKQGRRLGVPIATTMLVEARSLRRHRILAVREQAAKSGPKISIAATLGNALAILWFIAVMLLLNFRYQPGLFGLDGFRFGS